MTDPISRLNAAPEGRYSIERELGEGGMATVCLPDDLKHERKVAVHPGVFRRSRTLLVLDKAGFKIRYKVKFQSHTR